MKPRIRLVGTPVVLHSVMERKMVAKTVIGTSSIRTWNITAIMQGLIRIIANLTKRFYTIKACLPRVVTI